jgi:hypothetical protein
MSELRERIEVAIEEARKRAPVLPPDHLPCRSRPALAHLPQGQFAEQAWSAANWLSQLPHAACASQQLRTAFRSLPQEHVPAASSASIRSHAERASGSVKSVPSMTSVQPRPYSRGVASSHVGAALELLELHAADATVQAVKMAA